MSRTDEDKRAAALAATKKFQACVRVAKTGKAEPRQLLTTPEAIKNRERSARYAANNPEKRKEAYKKSYEKHRLEQQMRIAEAIAQAKATEQNIQSLTDGDEA